MSTSLSPSSACQINGGRSSTATVMPTWFTGLFVNVWIARSGREPPRNSHRSPVRVSFSAWSRVNIFKSPQQPLRLWTGKYLAADVARCGGRGEAGVAGHVIDHLFDFLDGQSVSQRDLKVDLQF